MPDASELPHDVEFFFDPVCPWTWMTSRWLVDATSQHGVDVTKEGSGNPGASNVVRLLGWKAGALVLVLDAAKGAIAAAAGLAIDGHRGAWILGVAAVMGHIFPVWSKFKGGRGVATGCCFVASGRPRLAATGSGLGALLPSVFGAKVTRPVSSAAGRTARTGCAGRLSRVEMVAASAMVTGRPWFSRITATFCSKRGGAGGGAERVTTARWPTAAGGRTAGAWRAATRSDVLVGTIGTAHRTTGARSTRVTIAGSRT